jgi:hypothetical protein
LFGAFLRYQDVDEERAQVSDEYTGGGMQAGCVGKKVEAKAKQKSYQGQCTTGNPEWQPKDVQEVDIRNYKAV